MLVSIRFTRTNLFLGILVAIIISNSFIFFVGIEAKEYNSHWIISTSAAFAASLAVFTVYRHRHHHGIVDKSYASLAIALFLWLSADIVWASYEVFLEVVPPVPSLADLLWLCAYGFIIYYLFSTYIRFYKKFQFSNKALIAAIIGSGIFLFYIVSITVSLADLSSPRGVAIFAVLVAYPVLDAMIIVPAVLILVNIRREPIWFTPWVCKAAGILMMAIADSWYALFVITSLTDELWPSSMFFAAHYIIIAAGLIWYIKFLTMYKDVDSTIIMNQNTDNLENRPNKLPEPNIKIHESKKSEAVRLRSPAFIIVLGLSASAVVIVIVALVSSSSIWPLTSFPFPFSTSDTTNGLTQISSYSDVIRIGALLPLGGVASSTGKSTEAALSLALEDVNANFSMSNSSLRYELVIENTESDPAKSLEKLKLLKNQGIKTVIGPATSAELRAVRDYADKNDILLISHSSTAPSLATEADNVFRFVPDDTHQAAAISTLMWDDGVRVVIPFWRNDIYGSELMHAVRENFQKMGGEFDMNNGTLGYEPRTGQLAASLNRINFVLWDTDLRLLESKVQQALSRYDSDEIGVYMISLDEVSPIFIQAHSHPTLSEVKWYGSDGSVLNTGLVRNHDSAHFAVNTSFYNPIYRIDNEKNEKLDHLMEKIRDEIHADASPYSAVAYDVLWVAAIAENETRHMDVSNNNNNFDNNKNTEIQSMRDLKEMLVLAANSYQGVTGNITLNRMGDRDGGNYDFWAVTPNDDDETSFAWQKVGEYFGNRTGTKNKVVMSPLTPADTSSVRLLYRG